MKIKFEGGFVDGMTRYITDPTLDESRVTVIRTEKINSQNGRTYAGPDYLVTDEYDGEYRIVRVNEG